ncbi:beta-propeller domain-containing protein [Microtetraspora niveoalba]|uniref:beta-propeller domain-containing protein n=1 Tax=Microtetraspora niveoalba TaxID=46175 RepID=UPI00083563A4|nr:beta-propeller domain-containing protein [Microtetraspora niveoalba]
MRTSIRTAGAVALAGLLAAACSGSRAASAPEKADLSGKVRLVSYTNCDDMLAGLRRTTAENVTEWGFGEVVAFLARDTAAAGKQAAVPEQAHSTTNVQEAGVDEPDLVKTDGKRVITVNRGVLRVIDTATREVTGTLRLVSEEDGWVPADLLVSGDRALVLVQSGGIIPFGAVAKMRPGTDGPRYMLVDLSGPPKLLGTLSARGSHIDARQVGSTVRIVVRSQPEIAFPQHKPDASPRQMLEANREAVRAAPIEAWLPRFEIASGGGSRTDRVRCDQVSHPEKFTGTSLLTVFTVDLAGALDAVPPISVAADGDTVYGTDDSLYVTSNPNWWFRPMPVDVPPEPVPETPGTAESTAGSTPGQGGEPTPTAVAPSVVAPSEVDPSGVAPKVEPSASAPEKVPATPEVTPEEGGASPTAGPIPEEVRPSATATGVPEEVTPSPTPTTPPEQTEVHRFDITGTGTPRYVSSGVVPGRLLNQYSLSEHAGHLRVATTSNAEVFGGPAEKSSSGVYVLNADTLAQVGAVTGLGKGERIYSVRFIGDVGYVVTFRQVDPLYTLDLRDPAAPRVTGELKISGYSSYLHPAGDGRLLGVGQEASAQGRVLGTQISLFDVADPATPRLLSRFHQRNSGSDAEWDPHAFLYWPQSGLAMLPLQNYGGDWRNGSSALVLKVSDGAIAKTGTIRHPGVKDEDGAPTADPGIRRCVVIGDTVWTFSELGVKVSDAGTLADRAWIPFT